MLLTFTSAFAAWDKAEPAGTRNISDIDLYVGANSTALESTLSGITGFKNLTATYTSASSVTVTADMLLLQAASSIAYRATSVSEVITITVSGASGLVSALSEASGTWYYVWIARKSADGTTNGFLSTSSDFTTVLAQLDSGYDQAAIVSAVRNNGSSNFINYYQYGKQVFFDDYNSVIDTSSPSATFADIDCSAFMPPLARVGMFNAKNLENNGAATTTTFYFRPKGSSATGTVIITMGDGHGSGGQNIGAFFELPVSSSQVIQYMSETQQRGIKMGVTGFILNI